MATTKTVEKKDTTITIIIPDPEQETIPDTGCGEVKGEEAFCAICQDEPVVATCKACKRQVGYAHFHPICPGWNDLCNRTRALPSSPCSLAIPLCTECASKRGGKGR